MHILLDAMYMYWFPQNHFAVESFEMETTPVMLQSEAEVFLVHLSKYRLHHDAVETETISVSIKT